MFIILKAVDCFFLVVTVRFLTFALNTEAAATLYEVKAVVSAIKQLMLAIMKTQQV